MKIKQHIFCFIMGALVSGCAVPEYLPKADEIDIDYYGSYIKVTPNTGSFIEGELIAIDTTNLYVLSEADIDGQIKTINIHDVKNFRLMYAKPKNYSWAIPVFTLATISHGYFAIFTAPINLIITTSVADGAWKSFQYSEEDMTYEELKMFARFPQGIPDGIEVEDIK